MLLWIAASFTDKRSVRFWPKTARSKKSQIKKHKEGRADTRSPFVVSCLLRQGALLQILLGNAAWHHLQIGATDENPHLDGLADVVVLSAHGQ